VCVAVFTLAAFNAGDAMASATGQITGTVTNAVTNVPISHIVACVREAGGSRKEECGESRESGEYEITGVPPGQYKALFYPVGLAYYDYYAVGQYVSQYDVSQYLSQYYPGVPVWSEQAQPVSVVGGAVTSGINARMHEGGWVAGTVTAAGSGAPLEGVEVCARNESGPWLVSSCTDTKAHGEYGYFFALEPGPYKIEFRTSKTMGYQQQYYNDVPLLSEAQPVIIEAGKTIGGISAALQPASAAAWPSEFSDPEIPPGAAPNGSLVTEHYTPPELPWANQSGNEAAVRTVAEQRAKEREEQKAREAAASYTAEQAALRQREEAKEAAAREAGKQPACVVPSLKGDTLAAARRALVKVHCRLGKVSRSRGHHKTLVVAGQSVKSGETLADGAAIAVKLGPGRKTRST